MNKKDVKEIGKYSDIIQDALYNLDINDIDDQQLIKIQKFKKLEIYELNLLLMRANGMSLREIGKELDISYQWVRMHLKNIEDKLQ